MVLKFYATGRRTAIPCPKYLKSDLCTLKILDKSRTENSKHIRCTYSNIDVKFSKAGGMFSI